VLLTPEKTPTKSTYSSDEENDHQGSHCKDLSTLEKVYDIYYVDKCTERHSSSSEDSGYARSDDIDNGNKENAREMMKKCLTRSNSDSILDSPKPTKPKIGRTCVNNSAYSTATIGIYISLAKKIFYLFCC
jgi:hypothetical protein